MEGVRARVFNATFNNISVISCRSVLLVEETGVPGENYRPAPSHIMLYQVHSSRRKKHFWDRITAVLTDILVIITANLIGQAVILADNICWDLQINIIFVYQLHHNVLDVTLIIVSIRAHLLKLSISVRTIHKSNRKFI